MKNYGNVSIKLFFALIFSLINVTAMSSNIPATKTTLNDHDSIHIFAALRFPTTHITDTFTLQIFKEIDETFGASGVAMDPLQIAHIKNTYLYLIFLAKLQKVQTSPAYQAYKSDFLEFLQDNNQRTPHLPTTKLVQSAAWKNIVITSQDLVASPLWQMFCKSMISDTYAYFATGLQIIHNVEKQEFNYVPHFETSYYNQDYTNLRTINAIVRTKILLEHQVKQRYIAQCISWKNLPAQLDASVTTTPTTTLTLEKAIVTFRQTPFYQTTHDIHTLLGTRSTVNAGQSITHQQLMSAPQLKSPLKEYVFGYYMLYELYGQLTTHMTEENLDTMIIGCSNSKLQPNIFPYTAADYVYLSELLAAKSKAEGTDRNSIHPTPKTFKPEDFRNPADMLNPTPAPTHEYLMGQTSATPSVQAQGFFSFFRHIGDDIAHDVKKGFNDIKHGAESAWNTVKHTAEAVGEGIAGFGCKMVFWDKSIIDEGERLSKESEHQFNDAGQALQSSIDQFAASIKDGIVAPIGELTGKIVGFVTQDKAIGASISEVIDNTADAIVQATAEFTGEATAGTLIYGMQETVEGAEMAADVTSLIVSSTEVIFTGGKYGTNTFLQTWHDTMHDCLTSITAAYTDNMQIVKAAIASVMQALGAIMNSMTSLFIDLSREITFLFTFAGTALEDLVTGKTYNPLKVADAAANHVNNVLNAHRAVINQVLGVVICVAADAAVDVASGGAGTAADAEMDAMIMGAAEGAEASAEATVEAAEEAATAAQESVSAAQDAVDNASQNLASAIEDGNEEAINAAKQALEDAKSGLENATKEEQEAAENVAKAQAKQALKNVADSVKDEAKTWGAKALRAGKEKLENALESLKSFPKNMAKNVANLMKSSAKIAEEAGKESETAAQTLADAKDAFSAAKQAYLDSLGTDGEVAAKEAFTKSIDELKEAQAGAKEAEEFAKSAKTIAEETKAGKALRYLKSGLKVFKPLGFAMNVAFNFTTMISGYNQDEENLLKQAQQAKELQDLWQANTQTKLSTATADLAYLEEISQKQYAAVGNQALGLALYQNYNYSFINQYQQSILGALAPIYVMQLMPNPNTGLIPGNIGTLWGLISNYLDLYPAQSFYTTTTGRTDFPFAQEIAQAPRLLTTSSTQNKQWFNQRCTAIDAYSTNNLPKKPTDPLSVKINLQFLYTLESEFHVGIYMGGNYHDYFSSSYLARLLNTTPANIQSAFANLQQLLGQTPQPSTAQYLNPSAIDLNEPYLAKMLVLYRNSANDPIKIGVYEHMGAQEWLLQQVLPITAQLSDQHTYTLQATLNGDSLNVALYVDSSSTPTVQEIIKVTPIANQRSYGIISSGAAIQWNQINPKPVINKNSTLRPATTTVPELQRGKQMKIAMDDALKPTFGSITLTPLSKQAILFGQYVYASTKTNMKKIDPKNPADFLVFATNTNGTITNIGKLPNSITDKKTNVLVSLITGHVLNQEGHVIKIIPNVWSTYKTSSYGPLPPALDTYITNQQKTVAAALSKITFGSFVLNIIDQASLQAGAYIYTSAQTIQDSSGKPMLDYVVLAEAPTTSNTPLQLGLPPTASNAGAILSLVTGNIYLKDTTVSRNVVPKAAYNYNVFTEFAKYAQEGTISTTDYATIKAAQTTYLAQQQTSNATPPPQFTAAGTIGSTQQISTEQLAIKQQPEQSKPQSSIGFAFHPKFNLANRRNQAAGDFKFQFRAHAIKA